MALAAATRLGPYEILDLIGAGGMGEVYKAKDTRLDRTVAIKVLPADISADSDRRARFEREAKTIAGLAHPHICTLHDVGEHDGSMFLVMEHLEGETLAQRLENGPLPIEQALTIGTAIAEALAAAHRQGIVHRDLKPGNVMLTRSGAKLLDFGLAKLKPSGTVMASVTMSALPVQEPATRAGAILGTVPYMAPEQLEGKETDARSDIFAFGALLYEMLTGRRAFQGDSHASTIAAILGNERPSPLLLRSGIPVALDRLVVTCLAKDPAERWQSARDIALHLAAPVDATQASSAARRPVNVWAVAIVLFTLGAIAGAVAGFGWWHNSLDEPSSSTHLAIPLPPGTVLAPTEGPAAGASVAISPDGRTVAYVVRDVVRKLAIRSLESGQAKTLAGTEGAMSPFFSPDGHWVGFFSKTDLRRVSIDDGTLITICQTPPVTRGGAWASDGTIYFSPDFSRGIQRVRASGGVPEDLTHVQFDSGESNHLLPELLPGGETLLFTVWKGGSFKDASVWSLSLRTGERKRLLESATAPRYVAPGYLAFAREGVLFAVPFDPVRMALAGDVFPVVDSVWTDPSTGSAHYAVAADGTLVFAAGRNTPEQRRLVWVDRAGHIAAAQAEPNVYGTVRLSPDGQRVALELLNDIWVYNLKAGTMTRVTYRGVNQSPVWTPDGRRMAISSSQGVLLPTLFLVSSEAGAPAIRLSDDEGAVQFPSSWAPDGRRLAYARLREGSDSGWDIRILDLDNPAQSTLIATPFTDDTPMISPDGRALAYVSEETGRPQVYLRPIPEQGTRIQVSTDGGTEPVWSRSGGELFFKNGRRMFAVRVRTQGSLVVGPPTFLFEGNFLVTSAVPQMPSYDVAPDGRFLMVTRAGERPLPSQLEVVLNWVAEVRRRVPQRTR